MSDPNPDLQVTIWIEDGLSAWHWVHAVQSISGNFVVCRKREASASAEREVGQPVLKIHDDTVTSHGLQPVGGLDDSGQPSVFQARASTTKLKASLVFPRLEAADSIFDETLDGIALPICLLTSIACGLVGLAIGLIVFENFLTVALSYAGAAVVGFGGMVLFLLRTREPLANLSYPNRCHKPAEDGLKFSHMRDLSLH